MKQKTIIERLVEHGTLSLVEGVYDPGIFKAIFLAGGPGAGKSSVSMEIFGIPKNLTFGSSGLKYINSDDVFTYLMKQKKIDPKTLSKLSSVEFDKLTMAPGGLRSRAKDLTARRMELYLQGKLGVIVDGTGHDADKIKKLQNIFQEGGYDTYMIFVNTSLDKALERNRKRDRVLPDKLVADRWNVVQHNLGVLHSMFGNNFTIIDNNQDNLNISNIATKRIMKFLKEPIKNPIGKSWIKLALYLKGKSNG